MSQQDPHELKSRLIEIFPEFAQEFTEEDEEFWLLHPLTWHRVWAEIAPLAHRYMENHDSKAVKRFADLINAEVALGGDRENAVATCFLEHASQVGVRKIIKPLLSDAAKQELR